MQNVEQKLERAIKPEERARRRRQKRCSKERMQKAGELGEAH